jgi:myo-inositol-1(or 4)-monophosphatase
VSNADTEAENAMIATLRAAFPEHAIVGKEAGEIVSQIVGASHAAKNALKWIVDPLDGTVNFAHGYPCFCVSIGVTHRGERTVGVVYEPLRDELFEAVRGGGARRNGKPIAVSKEARFGRALLATGFAYDVHDAERDNVANFARVVKQAGGVRRDGSAAIDLCYVACGRFEGYWELKLHAWDVAAGILIVEEAGGRVTDLAGGAPPASGSEIAASNGMVHDALLRVLRNE